VKARKTRFAVCTAKVFRKALVKSEFRRQVVTGGHSTLLAVTPYYPAGKCLLGNEVVEVLEEAYAKRRLPGTAGSTHDARERMPKFQITTHGWSGGENAPLPRHSPYLYPNGTDELSAKRRRLKKEILYIIYSGSVIIETIPPPVFHLRLIFFSVCTVTCRILVLSKTMSLITSKLTNLELL